MTDDLLQRADELVERLSNDRDRLIEWPGYEWVGLSLEKALGVISDLKTALQQTRAEKEDFRQKFFLASRNEGINNDQAENLSKMYDKQYRRAEAAEGRLHDIEQDETRDPLWFKRATKAEEELSSAQATIAQLRAEKDSLQNDHEQLMATWHKDNAERISALAEVASLREALPDPKKLEHIAGWFDLLDKWIEAMAASHLVTATPENAAMAQELLDSWGPQKHEIQDDLRAWARRTLSEESQ